MKIVVGLGNPGARYANTPHNVGSSVLDELAARYGSTFRRSVRFRARIARAAAPDADLLLVRPETFMNRSGIAVAAVLRFRKVDPADLVVILDDADLEMGRLRIRPGGGSGGHRGLQSIVDHVGSGDFARVRIGIGRAGDGRDLVDHVLGPFSEQEREEIRPVIRCAADAVQCVISAGVEMAMNEYNGRRPEVAGPEQAGDIG